MNKFVIIGIISIVTFSRTNAQLDITRLTQQFNTYQVLWAKTKLHLILNQNKFSPGDTIWFKGYFVKDDNTVVAGKQLINLHLTNAEGESKSHFTFAINNGLGNNQIIIPHDFTPGIYTVSAYSSWMKNFDPILIYKKNITIVSKNSVLAKKKPLLKAMPEGGHLISNVSNKISIWTGRPSSSVQIIDANGEEFGRTTVDQNGIGVIVFIPISKASYFVKIIEESDKIPLPAPEETGCSVLVTPSNDRTEAVKISINSPPGSILRNEQLAVVVSAQGKIFHTTSFVQHTKEIVELRIPQENLPEGIVHISLLNSIGRLIASRDFYSPGNAHVQAKIKTNEVFFQAREKIKFEVTLMESKGQPIEGQFSIRVFNKELLSEVDQNTFSDELNVFYGLTENFFIDRSALNWLTSLDNFLICFTEAVDWKKILSSNITKPPFTYTSAIQKNGTAYFADTHEPLPNFTQVMFYLQKSILHYQTFTQENGRISLAIPDIFNQDEFFYLAEIKGKEITNIKIEWDDVTMQLPHSNTSKETITPDSYATFTAKKRSIDQSYSAYTDKEKLLLNNTKINDFEDEINGADITINIQDYILFSTMEEMVKEISSSIYHRKSGDKNMVRIKLLQPMMAEDDPVYMIDGIATRNTDFFLSLKPSELVTLKIVRSPKKLLPLGLMGKNGIIMVQTKKNNVRESIDPSLLIEGINKPLDFPIRDYTKDQDLRNPDFRSTIYWNPNIKTDSNGKAFIEFYSSDDIGKLNIRIDGISNNGKLFSSDHIIEVRLDAHKN